MINTKHGGARAGAGRKPVEDKKVTVLFYPQQSRIDVLGIEAVKEIALAAVEKEYKKKAKDAAATKPTK